MHRYIDPKDPTKADNVDQRFLANIPANAVWLEDGGRANSGLELGRIVEGVKVVTEMIE